MSDQAGSGKKRRDSDSSSSLFRQFSSIRRFDPGYSSSHQASSSSVPAEEQEISSNSKTKQGSKDKKTFIKRSCPHCKKTLSKSSALEKHIERVHNRAGELHCPHCIFKTMSESEMKEHDRASHKTCPSCGKVFELLERHTPHCKPK